MAARSLRELGATSLRFNHGGRFRRALRRRRRRTRTTCAPSSPVGARPNAVGHALWLGGSASAPASASARPRNCSRRCCCRSRRRPDAGISTRSRAGDAVAGDPGRVDEIVDPQAVYAWLEKLNPPQLELVRMPDTALLPSQTDGPARRDQAGRAALPAGRMTPSARTPPAHPAATGTTIRAASGAGRTRPHPRRAARIAGRDGFFSKPVFAPARTVHPRPVPVGRRRPRQDLPDRPVLRCCPFQLGRRLPIRLLHGGRTAQRAALALPSLHARGARTPASTPANATHSGHRPRMARSSCACWC